jgi:hypothetical protein
MQETQDKQANQNSQNLKALIKSEKHDEGIGAWDKKDF